MAVVASEEGMEFRHFRLAGTRDYSLPPERCVTVEPDGVTLTVDLGRSDLLLETELPRFAEWLDRPSANGRRQYRLTPASLEAARAAGMQSPTLEVWFHQRTGHPSPPAARLLMAGAETPPCQFRRHLVLHVAERGDGRRPDAMAGDARPDRGPAGADGAGRGGRKGGGIAAAVERSEAVSVRLMRRRPP